MKLNNQDNRIYKSIVDWKENIWNKCPDKTSKETKKEFGFKCKKTGKICSFAGCYRNKKK